MEIFILTLVIILVSLGGLAIGVMTGREPLKGSCGGLACLKNVDCSACRQRKAGEQLP